MKARVPEHIGANTIVREGLSRKAECRIAIATNGTTMKKPDNRGGAMSVNRERVHQKFGGRCAYCGSQIAIKEMQVDHAIPQFRYHPVHDCLIVDGRKFTEYGLHDFRNLMPACRVCNNWKRTFTIDEFRREIEMQIGRLRQYAASFRLAERYNLVTAKEGPVIFYFETAQENRT